MFPVIVLVQMPIKSCQHKLYVEELQGQLPLGFILDGEGNYVRAEIEGSSGSSLLDNDALALAARSGGATNTTGEPKSDVFYIRYEFE